MTLVYDSPFAYDTAAFTYDGYAVNRVIITLRGVLRDWMGIAGVVEDRFALPGLLVDLSAAAGTLEDRAPVPGTVDDLSAIVGVV